MKIKKVIEVPYGVCSEVIIWQVGDETCRFVGPNTDLHYPLTNELDGNPFWWHILNHIGKEIPFS